MSRVHLDRLSTGIGIMQHARGTSPDPDHGYCTDDVARSLQVDLRHGRQLGWAAVAESVARNMAFLAAAFDGPAGRFRNFRDADGAWRDAPGSDDANARALLALGEAMGPATPDDVRSSAADLFERALRGAGAVDHLRPRATVLLACDAAERAGLTGEVAAVYQRVGNELRLAFESRSVTHSWPWPEPSLTYENELPAQALIVGGRRLGYPRMARTGFRVLDWLIEAQTSEEGWLSTIGNAGWWPMGGTKAAFDQQPIAATSLLLAAGAAHEETDAPRYARAMEMAYGWFLGRNDSSAMVAVPDTGGCHDGLEPDGVNQNQGAESTLMWHLAAERIHSLRSGTRSTTPAPQGVVASVS